MGAAARPTRAAAADGWLRRELGATLALGWPIILANVAINVMTATDFMMLGRLSPHALAAGSLGFILYQPLFLLGIGVVAALSPIAAAKIGAGQSPAALRRATHQALLSALFVAVVAWIVLIAATPFLLAIGEPADVARDAGVYLRGFQWGLAPSLLFFAARSVFAALERPRPALVAGLVAVAFNALANYALIFGKLGMPALGIIGSGLATTLSQALMFAILIAAALIDPRMRRLRLFALPWRPARRRVRGAVAARPADRRDDRRRGRRLLRRDAGDGPHRPDRARGAHDRVADRLARLHGPARPRPGGDGQGRPRLWRARPAGDFARRVVGVRPDGRFSPSSRRRR